MFANKKVNCFILYYSIASNVEIARLKDFTIFMVINIEQLPIDWEFIIMLMLMDL